MDRRRRGGGGLLNRIIDRLPFELHLPSYRFCGPGTKLKERLARGERGVNELDEACREHDIAYSQHKDLQSRHKADRVLADRAWARYKAKDVPFGEKSAAWLVTSAMKAKSASGSGFRRRRRPTVSLRKLVACARTAVRGSGLRRNADGKAVNRAVRLALKAATQMKRRYPGAFRGVRRKERVLPLPRSGGVLPLLPIFAGLSAIGSLAGGAAGVAKAINEAKDARRKLAEAQRHNETMEAIALRQGKGLYIKPYRKGLGLYMTPYVRSKNY